MKKPAGGNGGLRGEAKAQAAQPALSGTSKASARHPREQEALREEVAALRAIVGELHAALAVASTEARALAIDPAMLRMLLQLCHPDRHGGSTAATRETQATQHLLGLRREVAEVAQ